MIEIKDLLLNINNALLKETLKKDTIRSIVSEVINLDISSEDIEIKNNTVYLNIKSIYKNEILIKKDFISKKIEQSLGKKTPNNFR